MTTTNTMVELEAKAMKASAAFLERRGCEILEQGWTCDAGTADIIAEDDDGIRFIQVQVAAAGPDGFPLEETGGHARERFERVAAAYLTEHEEIPDSVICFDIISLLMTSEHRAFLKMHRNAFANDSPEG